MKKLRCEVSGKGSAHYTGQLSPRDHYQSQKAFVFVFVFVFTLSLSLSLSYRKIISPQPLLEPENIKAHFSEVQYEAGGGFN